MATETVQGLREFGRKLDKLGTALRGKSLRSAAFTGMLPALKEAKAAVPIATPPYGPYKNRWGAKLDPYPRKTYKGRLVLPGFTSRNVIRRSFLSKDKRSVTVRVGVKREAFYALSFIEWGTSRYPARPWLEPSFRRSKDSVLSRFSSRAKKLIENAAR